MEHFVHFRKLINISLLLLISLWQAGHLFAQTRLGLHYTAEEVAIWKTRSTQGPYKNQGDAGVNSPGDYTRILNSANAYIGSSTSTNYMADRWNGGYQGSGYVPEGFTSTITGYEPKGKFDKMLAAAFVYLITKDTRYSSRVKSEILTYYIKHPLMDFSNQNRWGLGSNSFNDINPGFYTAAGLTKLLYAYDYVKDTFSDQERAQVDAWFYKAGSFFRKVVDEKIGPLYLDRERSILKDPTVRAANSNSYKTHDNGYAIPNISHWYNNRRGDMVRFYTLVGIHLNDATMKHFGKLFFKEWLKFGIFPDGTMNEYYRSSVGSPEQGYQYSVVTVAQMAEIADAFARTGDRELYDFTTAEGLAATKGGSKNLNLVIQSIGKNIDKTLNRYYPGKAGQANYRIDGISQLESKHYTFDTWLAQANIYYKDYNFAAIYTRKKAGTPAYPSNATYHGSYHCWSGTFATFPGKLFMFGQMEGKVYPYPDKSGATPPLVLTGSATGVACYGAATGVALVSVSGGTSPYSYLWSNGATSSSISGLKSGAYSVTVTDAKGVKSSKTITIAQPLAISITPRVVSETASGNNGAITLTVSGGEESYSYKWSNGETSKDIFGLKAGTYTVEVSDGNSCKQSLSVSVNKSETSAQSLESFTLMNADNKQPLLEITNGMFVNINLLPSKNVNIRANTSPAVVGSVVFELSGKQSRSITESSAPYALFGDASGNYNPWTLGIGSYTLTATPYSQAAGKGTTGNPLTVSFTVVSEEQPAALPVVSGSSGTILREYYSNIPGRLISAVPSTITPDASAQLTSFETPVNMADNYAQRIRGYLHPTISGNYTFYIAADDQAELYLSSDENPATKRRIAYTVNWTSLRRWTEFASQKSVTISLTAGKKYYLEAIHKEGVGGDHLSVGWILPGTAAIEVISGDYLSPIEPVYTCTASGSISREYYSNITGTLISQIPVSRAANSISQLYSFEAPAKTGDNYGQRLRGYICAPESGNYTFYIAGDDVAELYLSTDDNAANKKKIASLSAYTYSRQWSKYASQKSVSIPLTKGSKYYIEALHKEGVGGDHLSVGWIVPNSSTIEVVPGKVLSPFDAQNSARLSFEQAQGETQVVHVFPNPFQDHLSVNVEGMEGKVELTLTDMLGRSIYLPGQIITGTKEQINLDISGVKLNKGVYVLTLTSANSVRQSLRVIKQ